MVDYSGQMKSILQNTQLNDAICYHETEDKVGKVIMSMQVSDVQCLLIQDAGEYKSENAILLMSVP